LQAFLSALLDTDDLIVEAADAVSHAIEWYTQGADFADAMHLSACGSAVMHTFDRDFCKDARQLGGAPEVNVWAVSE
jgi:predicted nucleic-acid-binding protein